MDTTKIIKGVVNSGRYTVTAPIVKEDYGLYLQIEGVELPSTYEVDFSNSEHNGTSVTMIGNSDGALIPHQFIDTGKDIFAFLYHVGENFGRTVYKFRIPNKVRPDRTEEQPTPEEQSVIDQAINALNEAVAQTAEDVQTTAQNVSASATNAQTALNASFSASADADRAEQAKDDAQTYANNASASATASAQSAEQSAINSADAQDSAEDAQGYAQASAQSASASANSATSAQGYAQSASSSAQSASGYASNAQTSANTASTKASEASTSAQTASNKASEASQSASQTSGYAQTAETAKVDAQTAKTQAESARDTAVQAKTDAESARDEAQNLVDGISGKVEQIGSNTERIESLEDDRYKPYVTDSASGSIASFPDGADDLPLKSLVVNIDPVQDLSQGDPSPENICPISGWIGVNINATGYNIWDEEWEVGNYNSDTGEKQVNNNQIRSKNFIPVKPNTSLYFNTRTNSRVLYYKTDRTYIGSELINSDVFVTPDNCYFINFHLGATYGTTYNHDISINYPSTDHDYHPYTGRSITIDLGQTVYGSKLYPLEGKAVINVAIFRYEEFAGNISSNVVNEHGYIRFVCVLDKKQGATNVLSNLFPTHNTVVPQTADFEAISGYSSGMGLYLLINASRLSGDLSTDGGRAAALRNWSRKNGLEICYELAEPIEIQLTPNQVNSLLGANNLWADSGDTEVEYRADTRLYIEKLTQPEEDDMIADSNIVSGQYFMVGNSLYKATANIANGAQIIVGTNATRVSLAQALNEINT